MRTRVVLAMGIAALLLTAGCTYEAGLPADNETATTTGSGTGPEAPTMTVGDGTDVRPDPPADRIGWENGVWYDDDLPITEADGLNDSELRLVVDRAMARVERIRDLEFERNVSVEVITREQYRERNVFDFRDDPFENQVYEALFLVDEDTSAATAFESLYGGSVAGYYYDGQIVIVGDNSTAVTVDRGTLAHELTHALQDQQLGSTGPGRTTDRRAAYQALPEGEANYVLDRYEERCASEWACIAPVNSTSSGQHNRGLFLTLFLPYSDGPDLVGELVDRGEDWTAVDDAWSDPPASTEQVIHPEKYPDEEPAVVDLPDRSDGEWEVVSSRGRAADTVGEAGVFAMLWANGVVPEESLFDDADRYNYSHPASAGWGGDTVRAYERDGNYAYVWRTVWDTERDAREFRDAYRELLASKGAVERGDGRYRIEDGNFADAFRVQWTGDTVTIVNAPTVADLDDVYERGGARAGVPTPLIREGSESSDERPALAP
ncbi:hypothetical protein BRD18_06065 [Halobacteriales archaeon SW_7_71_33]|nr:MAG: hypothetical protein BRD18_06065 [Halobacteriales archaeon SW_7_71_33]